MLLQSGDSSALLVLSSVVASSVGKRSQQHRDVQSTMQSTDISSSFMRLTNIYFFQFF